jgi:ferredoxin-NADP reductase
LASPHGVDRYLELFHPLWSLSEVRAVVVGTVRETDDAVTLRLRPNRNWRGFRAGQHVGLTIAQRGVRRTRCFSLSSSARRDDGLIDVAVKRQPGGAVTETLVSEDMAGRIVGLTQAAGTFTLPPQPAPRLLFVSAGSGITPCMAMLRTWIDERSTGRITFLHTARRYDAMLFRAELAAIGARHANIDIRLAVTGEPPDAGDLAGRFSRAQLAAVAPDFAACQTYACGPPGLLDTIRTIWRDEGIEDRLHVERFTRDRSAELQGSRGTHIDFQRSRRNVRSDGRTLLEQAEAAGLEPASGCRMGICMTCRCRKRSGAVRNLVSGRISRDDDETIQLCVSVPLGDGALEL